VDRGAEAVRTGKGFNGSGPFGSFPFLCRPNPLQFVLENDAKVSGSQSFVNMPVKCIHGGRLGFSQVD
jgi:hypothetical protein